MAAIPCVDYIIDGSPLVPLRPKRANPDAIRNRWVNFVASMDLSPEQDDDVGEGVLAWSIWDIPASHCAQIDDDRGEDLICVAIRDNVYWLDWRRYKDEWDWGSYAAIEQLVRFGPIPSSEEAVEGGRAGYDVGSVKRLHSFEFNLADGSVEAAGAKWWVTAAEWENEPYTQRTAIRHTTARMKTKIAVKGRAFIITLEHTAEEPINITYWKAVWDAFGGRIRQSGIVK